MTAPALQLTAQSSDQITSSNASVPILIVDDNAAKRFALRSVLGPLGYDIVEAESGLDALRCLITRNFAVILLDVRMPIMDGYETIRAIRSRDQFATLPVIALTGKVVAGERQRCLDAGADDYVPKPVNSADLFAALEPWIAATTKETL